jgi:adenylate cyclase
LIGEDEAVTLRTLKAYRDVLYTLIQQHNGKALDSQADHLLAEFVSVVDTVQFAVAVSSKKLIRNSWLNNRK